MSDGGRLSPVLLEELQKKAFQGVGGVGWW